MVCSPHNALLQRLSYQGGLSYQFNSYVPQPSASLYAAQNNYPPRTAKNYVTTPTYLPLTNPNPAYFTITPNFDQKLPLPETTTAPLTITSDPRTSYYQKTTPQSPPQNHTTAPTISDISVNPDLKRIELSLLIHQELAELKPTQKLELQN